MDKLTKLLKYVDNMGKDFKFKIEGKNLTTVYGGILTILTWVGFICCIWYFEAFDAETSSDTDEYVYRYVKPT